jgi:hypothetical protein
MSNFSTKIFGLAGASVVFAGMAFGQQATCAAPVATTTIIRAEGTSELVASVTFVCTSAAGQLASLGINSQVFLSPALPVTSRVLAAGSAPTEATLTITSSAGPASTISGTVSGSTINFSGITPAAALPAGGTLTFTITNVRINATSLSVTTGVPPSVSETVFVSGPSVVPAALSSNNVAFAQNGLGALKTFKTYTTAAFPLVVPATSGANNFVICNAYSPKASGVTLVSGGGASLAAVVEVNENFAQAFKTAGDENPQGSALGTISTRVKLNFANVPSNVTIVLPSGTIAAQVGTGVLQWVTSDTGATVQTTDGLSGENGLALRAVLDCRRRQRDVQRRC